MTKRTHEQGQISIFFSASLIVLISIIAFVINIGLFVKAKINLQNATDAAAFSGAAVQARQLTKIAYLNWEMRNIYKEWMYKYYVIGNLNVEDVENPGGAGVMKFNLRPDENVLSGVVTKDPYNIPAVCIHIAGSKTNICKRYAIPGLPEFGSSNLPGAEEASRAFMDTLIATKVNDCVDRTRLNMLVATTWTYNVLASNMDESLAGRAPAILADRQGAWPRAVELGLRIRNLEFAMNRPAVIDGVCQGGGGSTSSTNCQKGIGEIVQERKLGNERILKAFYSGYRNLGNSTNREMKDTFTLSEIRPKPVAFTRPSDASYLLVPADKASTYEKQWVDLKLMMVNYAIFYAAMIPRADSATSGACDVTKVAIPVPGYPLGFYKNPDVLTYYAVRGEAEFVGLFNPFTPERIKLTAYSAAKPMGGRIGPMLFTQKQGQDYFLGRNDTQKRRSVPYITSYDFTGTPVRSGGTLQPNQFEPGVPLPINTTTNPGPFWLEDENSPLGGLLADASGVKFGVPNLVYDYQSPYSTEGYTLAGEKIYKIRSASPATEQPVGLYSKFQFNAFKGPGLSATVSPGDLDAEIARVRAPTLYEAANYLIPSPNSFNIANQMDSFGFIGTAGTPLQNGVNRHEAYVYAPLYKAGTDQEDILFDNPSTVTSTIFEFMRAQETGMRKYKMSLNKAAQIIDSQKNKVAGGAKNSAPGYERAARGVSDINMGDPNLDQNPGSCNSIAGQFLYFYYGGGVGPDPVQNEAGCPKPLGTMISEYFAASANDPTFNPTHYHFSFSWPANATGAAGERFFTAYMPGPFTGVGDNGTFSNPIPGSNIQENMRRNFYSTKFVTLDSLLSSGGYGPSSNFSIISEGTPSGADTDVRPTQFANPLDPDVIGSDLNSIKY
ncbi:Tad domain-containing protein [Peredibacter sp. HCB2-198]|uniref:Tad domain-containing protein n=1 Tax=Peredibacter sp. HCB2-198 TaxID=3383025 RepID=UPI0038B692AB